MIRLKVSGPNFEPILAMLDRLERPPLGNLAATLREIMIEDNREGLLAGTDEEGDPTADLADSTIRRGRGGDGPPRVPRGAASRAIASYDVDVQQYPDRLLLIGSWSDAPFVHFLDAGTKPPHNMPSRPMVGIRPAGQAKVAEALDAFVAELVGSF